MFSTFLTTSFSICIVACLVGLFYAFLPTSLTPSLSLLLSLYCLVHCSYVAFFSTSPYLFYHLLHYLSDNLSHHHLHYLLSLTTSLTPSFTVLTGVGEMDSSSGEKPYSVYDGRERGLVHLTVSTAKLSHPVLSYTHAFLPLFVLLLFLQAQSNLPILASSIQEIIILQ